MRRYLPAMLLLLPLPVQGQTYEVTASVVADAHVGQDIPNNNTGTSVVNRIQSTVGQYRVAYFAFDLRGVVGTDTATYKVSYQVSAANVGQNYAIKLYECAAFSEQTITWNNAPGLNRSTLTGVGTPFATITAAAQSSGGWSVDVTTFIKSRLGTIIYFLAIDESRSNKFVDLQSKESATGGGRITMLGATVGGGGGSSTQAQGAALIAALTGLQQRVSAVGLLVAGVRVSAAAAVLAAAALVFLAALEVARS